MQIVRSNEKFLKANLLLLSATSGEFLSQNQEIIKSRDA